MFCKNCGKELEDNTVTCPNCGQPTAPTVTAPAKPINNHLVGAILVTLFCCLPLGIVSIVYASKVNSLIAVNDMAGAASAADKAKTWMIWSLVIGGIINIAVVVIQIAAAVVQASAI